VSKPSQQRKHTVTKATLDGLYRDSFIGITVHRDFDILYANQKVANILGYGSANEMQRAGDLSPHIPRRRRREISARWAAIERGDLKPERNRVTNITCDGHELWLDVTDENILWQDGAPAIMSTIFDVSTSVSTNESLLTSLRHLEISMDSILETIPTGIAIFTEAGEPKTVNSAMRLLFQSNPQANSFISPQMSELLTTLVNSDVVELAARGVETHAGKIVDLIARRMTDGAIMMCAADVSDWKRMQDELKTLAERDMLTQLFNRRGFVDTVQPMLKTCTEKKQSFALLVADLDHFKTINDLHGHAAGDLALKNFAMRLSKALRPRDVVGRIGGDEFAIFLPDSDLETAERIAERLRAKIAKHPVSRNSTSVPITASFGLKMCSADRKHPKLTDLLQEADNALYRAKQAGRNQVALA